MDRVSFSVWDRWFLLVLFDQHGGAWQSLRDALRTKLDGAGYGRDDAEAKLSHLADLERRWQRLDEAGRERLIRDCRDPRLLRRARAKVLEQSVERSQFTPPMRNTPRRRLRARALRGYWPRFPVSPACYEPRFDGIIHARDFFGARASFGLARRLGSALERELKNAPAPADRTAVLRAFLTSFMTTMERADDSCGVLGDLAWEEFPKYFAAPWRDAGLSPELYYRDFLEFATWEDYGLLFQKLDPFFAAIPAREVALVDGILQEIHEELRAGDLAYQAKEALALRAGFEAVRLQRQAGRQPAGRRSTLSRASRTPLLTLVGPAKKSGG